MEAKEFVKEHSINEAKRIISTYPSHTHVTNDARMFINSDAYKKSVPHFSDSVDDMVKIDDLKTLVDAWELVESRGGLSEARAIEQQYWNSGVGSAMLVAMEIKQAIKLVEQCQ